MLDALWNLSDHLPVFADYQLPAKLGVSSSAIASTRVIVGATLTQSATVRNDAPVTSSFGADELDYAVSLTGFTSQTGTIAATGAAQVKTFTLNTATPGPRALTLNVTTSSKAAEATANNQGVTYTVVAGAKPSLSDASVVTSGTFDIGIVALGLSGTSSFGVYNLPDAAGAALTAGLDIDSATVTGDAGLSANITTPLKNLPAGGNTSPAVTFSATATGNVTGLLSLTTSDEDLPGAAARATLEIQLTARGAYAGDTNLSDTVDFDDLLTLAQNYPLAAGGTWFTGDFDRSGTVTFDDLLALAQNYGIGTGTLLQSNFSADWALAQSLVPEPTLLLTLPTLLAFRRRRG